MLVTAKPHMRDNKRSYLLHLILVLSLSAAFCTPSFAEGITLQSIGPRIGFGEKAPLMGKEAKYYFHLYDVAAVIKLPWSWPIGESTWGLETRLLASAGLLTGATESSLIMTLVPGLALNGWNGFVTFDAGAGAGFFTNHKFGEQDFGGPVQITATVGARINPFSHAYTGVRVQHFSDAGLYGPSSLGMDLFIIELGYKF
jgi:hypothetical protein